MTGSKSQKNDDQAKAETQMYIVRKHPAQWHNYYSQVYDQVTFYLVVPSIYLRQWRNSVNSLHIRVGPFQLREIRKKAAEEYWNMFYVSKFRLL